MILITEIFIGAIPKSSSSALIKPKVEYLPHNFQPVVDKINQGYRVAIILRGLPGEKIKILVTNFN